MKRVVYSDILDIDKICSVYHKIMYNTKHRNKIFDYNMFYTSNIISIYNVLKNKTYSHGKYNIFLIREPKSRIIMSESLNDKIVNHLVSDYLLYYLIDKRLLDVNVATRINKGSKASIYYMKKYLNLMKGKYGDSFYILKCDISKYFYNINHDILLSKLRKIIRDDDIYSILYNIITSTSKDYVNDEIRGIIKKYNVDVPLYIKGKGLPIGNQTSQILAIYYLNDLDHYIKEKLHIKYYIRYMDDFILIHHDKKYLKWCMEFILIFLKREKLCLNKKSNIISMKNGITFLGYKYIFRNNKLYMLVPSFNKRRIKRRISKGITNINNYNGYLKYADASYFSYKYGCKK